MADYRAVLKQLQAERDRLDNAIKAIEGIGRDDTRSARSTGGRRGRRRLSAAGRARIAAAQRARWAKKRRQKTKATGVERGRKPRHMSAAARAKIAAAQRARWAKQRKSEKPKTTAPAS
jgi:hypothetical protein